MDKSTQAQQLRRHIDESDKVLTPEDIQQLKASKPYLNGLKAIKEAEAGKGLSKAEFSLARDLLLVKFSIATGCRPGPLNNATLEDYDTAREDEGTKVILVAKHKRSRDGPAILGMDEEMQRLMHIYVNKIRPIYVEEVEEALFVKDDGHAFREGTIGQRVTEFWAKSGVRRNERLSHTSMRKYIATKTYEQAPEEAPTVQRVLGHSDKTFKRAYVRQECTRTGAEGLAVIAKVTSATDISQKKHQKNSHLPSLHLRRTNRQALKRPAPNARQVLM